MTMAAVQQAIPQDQVNQGGQQKQPEVTPRESEILKRLNAAHSRFLTQIKDTDTGSADPGAAAAALKAGAGSKVLESFLLSDATRYKAAHTQYIRDVSAALGALKQEKSGLYARLTLIAAGITAASAIEIAALTNVLQERASISNPLGDYSWFQFIIPASVSLLGAKAYADNQKSLAYAMAAAVGLYFIAQNPEARDALTGLINDGGESLRHLFSSAGPGPEVAPAPLPSPDSVPAFPGSPDGLPPVDGAPDLPPAPSLGDGAPPPIPGDANALGGGPADFSAPPPGLVETTQSVGGGNDFLKLAGNDLFLALVPALTIVVAGKLLKSGGDVAQRLNGVTYHSAQDAAAPWQDVPEWRRKLADTSYPGLIKAAGVTAVFMGVAAPILAPALAITAGTGLLLAGGGALTYMLGQRAASPYPAPVNGNGGAPTIQDQQREILEHVSAPVYGSDKAGVISAESLVQKRLAALLEKLGGGAMTEDQQRVLELAAANATEKAEKIDEAIAARIEGMGQLLPSKPEHARALLPEIKKALVLGWVRLNHVLEKGAVKSEAAKKSMQMAEKQMQAALVLAGIPAVQAEELVKQARIEAQKQTAQVQAAAASEMAALPMRPANGGGVPAAKPV